MQTKKITGLLSLVVTGIAVGVSAMFLLDPERGRARRSKIGQKGIKLKNKTLRIGEKLLSGKFLRSEKSTSDDEALRDRIRLKLGRKITHPETVDIQVSGGEVTLSGSALKKEAKALLKIVRSVRGVEHINNELEIHRTMEHIPSRPDEAKAYIQ